jgi:methionyl-tRNA formyltransferase
VPQASDAGPGTLVESGPTLGIATGEGLLVPVQVQPENRKAMGWGDFLRGARLTAGTRVTEIHA